MRWSVLAASLSLGFACVPPPREPVAGSAASTPVVTDEWRCGGELVPPTGWQQETAFADATVPNARDVAATDASHRLGARLCATAGGEGCDVLASHIRLWKTGSNGQSVCAMSVIKVEDLAEWRGLTSTLASLDDKLGAATRELLQGLPHGARVGVDQVVDRGVPGGERAEWLRTRTERLVARAAKLVAVPARWAGASVPDGLDVVVRGNLVARQEQGVPILEAIWTARFRDGRNVVSSPVTFPERAAPAGRGEGFTPVESSPGLSIRMESSRGGSLCAGERTQLWLESDAAAHVRVFDLYGAGDALAMFPNEWNPRGQVEAGREVPLGGPKGFEAVPVPGSSAERYLVVAAPSEQGLGRLAKAHGQCRIPPDVAHDLFVGKGLPAGARVAVTGYRILEGAACPAARPSDGLVEALAATPVCAL